MLSARLAVAVVTAAAAFMAGRTLGLGEPAVDAPARLALPPLPAEARRDLAIVHAKGSLERGEAGAFAPAPEGSVLATGQTLRVGAGAEATLRLGVASRLSLSAGSEITALKRADGVLALRIERGKAEVELNEPGRALVLTSSDGAEVRADGATGTRFLVAAHPGRLAVINPEGAAPVRLIAAGETVQVPERRVSWSVRGAAPRPPIEPPSDPELEIVSTLPAPAPDAAGQAEAAQADEEGAQDSEGSAAAIVIRGRTHPLSLLKVGGVVVEVAADGSFEVTVPRQSGPTQLLASLPTGAEALLEVPGAPRAGAEANAPNGADAGARAEEDEPPEVAAAREPADAPPVVEEPEEPKPKPRVKRDKPRRQKKARAAKRTQKRTQKATAKKKAGVVIWGASP